eukprot:TRINITY_DN19806_c0_g1_i4.p1 TRINITY_DN19806_c0_g1~~TRINITY_DN19806_c0_g1_i4.p1  ORF type:complete len:228 (+),score=87.29 TRINITY_DN19806_c0_g1_i4:60-743(+)
MHTQAVVSLLLGCAVAASHGASLTWTGKIDEVWENGDNWEPAYVPGPNDDVIINNKSPGSDAVVVLRSPRTVRSVVIGEQSTTTATLDLQHHLNITEVLEVQPYGTMKLSTQLAELECNAVGVAGQLQFFAGTLSTQKMSVTGYASFLATGEVVFNNVKLNLITRQPVMASGQLKFVGNCSLTSSADISASGTFVQFNADPRAQVAVSAGGPGGLIWNYPTSQQTNL